MNNRDLDKLTEDEKQVYFDYTRIVLNRITQRKELASVINQIESESEAKHGQIYRRIREEIY